MKKLKIKNGDAQKKRSNHKDIVSPEARKGVYGGKDSTIRETGTP